MKPKTAAGAAALVAYFVAQSDNEMAIICGHDRGTPQVVRSH
jgi:hypothetical protein